MQVYCGVIEVPSYFVHPIICLGIVAVIEVSADVYGGGIFIISVFYATLCIDDVLWITSTIVHTCFFTRSVQAVLPEKLLVDDLIVK